MSTQGQSLVTIDKERRIGAALSVSMKIANAKFGGKRFKFWHLDANAGSGWNDEVSVPGSPVVFWQAARQYLPDMIPAPFFCDHTQDTMKALQRQLDDDARAQSFLIPGDNEEAIDVFAESIRRSGENPGYAVGTMLIDPNGYFYRSADGTGAPVKPLQWFCREFPRIDLILNLNMRTFHMQRAHGHAVLPPREVLNGLGKSNWLVCQARRGNARFLLAIGRNVSTGDHRSLGLHASTSEIGRAILDAETKQGTLFDVRDLSGLPRPSGVPRGAVGGVAPDRRALRLRRASNGGPPPAVSALGDVRRAIEPAADLPCLPLSGAREA